MKHTAVIIVAGGSGQRMESIIPKQFMLLNGLPILMHTILKFSHILQNANIIVVLPASHTSYWNNLLAEYNFIAPHTICEGGDSRFESVSAGLKLIGDAQIVAIHDGVRPLVDAELIERAIEDAKTYGAVAPIVKINETMREMTRTGSRIIDRNNFRLVQTPQVFKADIISKAYLQPYNEKFTDDASVVESNGTEIYLCEGSYSNIKITTVSDLAIAESLMKTQQ